jgi:hypothetical protein
VTLADTKGAGDLGIVNLIINRFLDGRKACYLAYVAPTNTLILVNDAGDAGGPYAGSMKLDGRTNAGISNSQCAVNGSGSAVALSPNTLSLTLNLSFRPAFAANHVIYAAGRDAANGNNTDWQAVGTFTVR